MLRRSPNRQFLSLRHVVLSRPLSLVKNLDGDRRRRNYFDDRAVGRNDNLKMTFAPPDAADR